MIREAKRKDGKRLAPRLRTQDKREIRVIHRVTPKEALTRVFDKPILQLRGFLTQVSIELDLTVELPFAMQ